MGKQEILNVLGEYKRQSAKTYGIVALGIFGSTVRDAAREESDVDVVVSLLKPDLFAMAGIKAELEERMHRSVDLVVYRERMNSFLKHKIDQEAIYV